MDEFLNEKKNQFLKTPMLKILNPLDEKVSNSEVYNKEEVKGTKLESIPLDVNNTTHPPRIAKFVTKVAKAALFIFYKPLSNDGIENLEHAHSEMQKTIDKALKQLTIVRDKIKILEDEQLFKNAETSIEYLLKSVQRIKKSEGVISKQGQLFKRYNEWINKIQPWIQLEAKITDKDAIITALVQHFLNESSELINRDVQVVKDYQQQILDQVQGENKIKSELIFKMEVALKPFLDALKALKENPPDLKLDRIVEWKKGLDIKRGNLFEKALHTIDDLVVDVVPVSKSEEEHERIVEILTQIAYMEEELPHIMEIVSGKKSDDFQLQLINSRISSLEEEVYQLNLDTRLTPELTHRLQILMQNLDYVSRLIA
jgi:hypothetical protein